MRATALHRRIVRALEETGPAPRTVINGIARDDGETLEQLLASGRLVKISDRRGAVYGVPGQQKRKPA